jgi:hypothetical protein
MTIASQPQPTVLQVREVTHSFGDRKALDGVSSPYLQVSSPVAYLVDLAGGAAMAKAGTMHVLVVFESLFGNTHEVAEAIADGARTADPTAEVACVRVAEADPEVVKTADLLVVGGPTHMRGMTSGLSRKMGLTAEEKKDEAERHETEPGAEGPGIRDWFADLPRAANGRRAAAFDTRGDARMAGGAAHGIARRLRRHGYDLVAEPEGFIIEGTDGPLRAGEPDRARAWGANLVQQIAG